MEIHIRDNNGFDTYFHANTEKEALRIAENKKVTDNHMICIVDDGFRYIRWDRDRVVGENSWCECDPEDMEVLGKIREVVCRSD